MYDSTFLLKNKFMIGHGRLAGRTIGYLAARPAEAKKSFGQQPYFCHFQFSFSIFFAAKIENHLFFSCTTVFMGDLTETVRDGGGACAAQPLVVVQKLKKTNVFTFKKNFFLVVGCAIFNNKLPYTLSYLGNLFWYMTSQIHDGIPAHPFPASMSLRFPLSDSDSTSWKSTESGLRKRSS
jgi:hypothetical protein